MMCIEHIASVPNVTYESKICGLPLLSLCRFRVISVVSGHNYGDVGVRTLKQEFFYKDICISHADQGLENKLRYMCTLCSDLGPCCMQQI